MLDIRLFRDDLDGLATAMARRGVPREDLERIRDLDERRRALITAGDELRSRQKQMGREVGAARDDEERRRLIAETKGISAEIDGLTPQQDAVEADLEAALAVLPNLPHAEAPDGDSDADAVELFQFGERPQHDFDVRDHVDIGEALDLIDLPRGAKVSGSRFAYLKGQAVILELALVRYALDVLAAKGFTPMIPPVLTREHALYGTGFLPGTEEQLYKVPEDDLYLVGTSEVPLAAYHGDEILPGADLPVRYAGFSTNFRREAGTYGKDTRGIFRVHQFDKVEMFVFTRPEDAEAEHARLRDTQVELLSGLGLHGRVVDIPVGDLGASAARKYDCEVWLPGQEAYRELTSASNCTDYQARRLATRYRDAEGEDTQMAATLNGTACAVGRTIIAVLETHQQADGSVAIPEALQPYFGGDRIEPVKG
jgi:seryl-tRNA synthetase